MRCCGSRSATWCWPTAPATSRALRFREARHEATLLRSAPARGARGQGQRQRHRLHRGARPRLRRLARRGSRRCWCGCCNPASRSRRTICASRAASGSRPLAWSACGAGRRAAGRGRARRSSPAVDDLAAHPGRPDRRQRGLFDLQFRHLRAIPARHLPPAGFDPKLSAIDFSFKVECPSDFDCADTAPCPPAPRLRPEIDYLAATIGAFAG